MSKAEAIKKVWELVEGDKIREAKDVARQYGIEMCFGDNYIAVRMTRFISNKRKENQYGRMDNTCTSTQEVSRSFF